jgi:hypothetical protein
VRYQQQVILRLHHHRQDFQFQQLVMRCLLNQHLHHLRRLRQQFQNHKFHRHHHLHKLLMHRL